LQIPLLFAVRFTNLTGNAIWSVVWDRDHKKTSLTITAQDLIDGVGRVIWDDFLLMFRPDLRLIRIYDSAATIETPITNKEHGGLVAIRYVTDEHDIRLEAAHAMVHSAFAIAIGFTKESQEISGTVTQIVSKPNVTFAWFSNLMYRFNH